MIPRSAARRSSTRPTRSTACGAAPVRVPGRVRRPSRRLPLPVVRPHASAARRRRPRDRTARHRRDLVRPLYAGRHQRAFACRSPASTTSTTRSRRRRSRGDSQYRRRRSPKGWVARAGVRPLRARRRRREDPHRAARQEPAGANETLRTLLRRSWAIRRRARSQRRHSRTAATCRGSGTSTSRRWRRGWSGSSPRASARRSSHSASRTAAWTRRESRSCPSWTRHSTGGSS